MKHYSRWRSGSQIALVVMALLVAVTGCSKPATVSDQPAVAAGTGSYTLVSIGPGDADLLTVRALKAIERADLVFCRTKTRDKLSSVVDLNGKKVIDGYGVLFRYYGRDCSRLPEDEQTWRGKTCEQFHSKQDELIAQVRQAVSSGQHVVMLTGGDPTIYGPDLWTVKALKDLNPTVVPGLSALNAANAALKASLGEVIITAPFQQKGRPDTIEQLAGHESATMIIFMPRQMDALLKRLAHAYPADMPVAVVSHAGCVGKETVIKGTVADIGSKLDEIDIRLCLVYVGKSIGKALFDATPVEDKTGHGKFYLVGMGPGDADLATLRALNVIEKADLIFAGRRMPERYKTLLAGKKVLNGFGRLFPFYGKSCSDVTPADKARERLSCDDYHRKQEEFIAIVRKAVSQGKTVAMLDSGDPLIFGPCSWSLTALQDLPTEVVPGLSCFNAANAALQAGVTQGSNSHSVLLASGWSVDEMAVHQSTMVLFTMRTEFKKFIDSLSRHYAADTPVAIVAKAGYAEHEKVIHGKLGTIFDQVGRDKLPFEHLLYVGDFLADGGRVAN